MTSKNKTPMTYPAFAVAGKRDFRFLHFVVLLCFALCLGCIARAQQIATPAELPDAPAAASESVAASGGSRDSVSPQDAGVPHLSFVPNLRPLSVNSYPPAQSVKEKFFYATEDNLDFFSIGVPALSAGFKELINATPEFGSGPEGYGRYYWHSWVDRAIKNYSVEFVLPAITHEDSRYYSLGRSGGSRWQRMGHAAARVLVTRSDSGANVFNVSEIVGTGMASGLANLYYPQEEQRFSDVAERWGLNIGFDASGFMLREFWPDIHDAVFRGSKPMVTR